MRQAAVVRLFSFVLLAPGVAIPSAHTQSALPQASTAALPNPVPQSHATHYTPNHFSKRANMYYRDVWGIEGLVVRSTESGELIRFSYRVLDPERAALLNDKKQQPTLLDPAAGVQLVIPSLEKVGQLRQSSTPEAGRDYWMAFSNPGRHVKKGDRVEVHIGSFQAMGLVVD
jgi:hypothetical protein